MDNTYVVLGKNIDDNWNEIYQGESRFLMLLALLRSMSKYEIVDVNYRNFK